MLFLSQKKIKRLIVITGPTASGKTALSVSVAQALNTVVFSADSRQFYRELSIGTAKPDPEEMGGVKHYFIDSHQLDQELTAAQFEKEAYPLLLKEFESHDEIILTGGSGLFIDTLCFGLNNIPTDYSVKAHLNDQLEKHGLEFLQEKLKTLDPEHYQECDIQNSRRVIRALEAIEITGKKYSELRQQHIQKRPFSIEFFIIDHDREILYDRINKRVDLMFEAGLENEARSVLDRRELTTLNTVGYQELFQYFDGEIDLNEAIDLIKRNTRRYAKRQLTWFRRYTNAHWIPYSDLNKMTHDVLKRIDRTDNQTTA